MAVKPRSEDYADQITNQNGDIVDLVDKEAYQTGNTTEATLADDDKIPFYDTSASAKRNSTWSNIKAKLKTYFDTLYGSLSSVTAIEGKIPSSASSSNKLATASDVSDIWSANAVLGAQNLLVNKAVSETRNGITLTVNDDKSLTLDSNGSAVTTATSFKIYNATGAELQWMNGLYFSGLTDGGTNKYILKIGLSASPYTGFAVVNDKPVLISGIPNTSANIDIVIYVYSGVTLNDLKAYPMVSVDANAVYAPYAMTNGELTEAVATKADKGVKLISTSTNLNTFTDEGVFYIASATNQPDSISSFLLENYVISANTQYQLIKRGSGENMYLRTKTGGNWNSWYKFTGTALS